MKIKYNLPLFWKFSIAIAAIVLVFGVINEYVISTTVKNALDQEYKRRGIYIVKNLANQSVSSLLLEDYISLQNNVNFVKNSDSTVAYVFILDKKNHIIVHTFDNYFPEKLENYNIPKQKEDLSFAHVKPVGSKYVILDIAMPLLNGELGTIRLGISETSISAQIEKTVFIFRLMVLFFLVCGIVSAFIFANIITRPIRNLQNVTRNMYLNSSFKDAIPKLHSKYLKSGFISKYFQTVDEVDLLILEFNRMIERLENAQQEIDKAQKILLHSEKLATLGQMSSSLAHEINNPLAGIRNCIKRLERNPENVEQNINYLILMNEATSKIERVIKNYLNFSRIDDVQFDDAMLSDVIANSLLFVSHRLEKINIVVENDIKPPDLKLYCSARHIEQVLINLFINAIDSIEEKISNSQKCERRIIIKAIQNDYTYITITDSGVGIEPEKLEIIFEPFFTTKQIGSGTGLGLSIVSSIVNMHKGTISVESKPGEGTSFIIKI